MFKVLFNLFVAVNLVWGLTVPQHFRQKADSLFDDQSIEKQVTSVAVFREKNQPKYLAATIKTVPGEMKNVIAMLQNVDGYGDASGYIKKSKRIRDSVYLIVVGAGIAKAWFIADLDSITQIKNGYKVCVRRNRDSVLNESARQGEMGLFTIEYRDFKITWILREIASNKVRLGLISEVAPNIWIPDWLFLFVSKILFPSILTDFEKHIVKISSGTDQSN